MVFPGSVSFAFDTAYFQEMEREELARQRARLRAQRASRRRAKQDDEMEAGPAESGEPSVEGE